MGLRGRRAHPIDRIKLVSAKPSRRRSKLSRSEAVASFLQGLRITSGAHAGTKLRLRGWQHAALQAIYATDPSGHRSTRTAVMSMGRKSGKTTFAAALALRHLAGPEAKPRGQIVSAAADRGQASLIYNELKAFILADKDLHESTIIRDYNKTIEHVATGSMFTALSADHRKAHGLSPTVAICDELALGAGDELFRALQTGQGAHTEPLMLVISTRCPDPDFPLGGAASLRRRRGGWRDRGPGLRVVRLHRADRAGSLRSGDLGARKPRHGRRPARRHCQSGPASPPAAVADPDFDAFVLNRPVATDDRFISPEDWDGCAGDTRRAAEGPCYGGLDLAGGAADLCSYALYLARDGPIAGVGVHPGRADGGEGAGGSRAIQPMGGRRARRGDAWAGDRPGMAGGVAGAGNRGARPAGDRSRPLDARRLGAAMRARGRDATLRAARPGIQGHVAEHRRIRADGARRQLAHGGNPLLRWAVSNAAVEPDPAGNRKLSKMRSVAASIR